MADPGTFDPHRFVEPRAEHKRHRFAYAPWGGGAHKCIGIGWGRSRSRPSSTGCCAVTGWSRRIPDTARWDYGGLPVPRDGMPMMLRRR